MSSYSGKHKSTSSRRSGGKKSSGRGIYSVIGGLILVIALVAGALTGNLDFDLSDSQILSTTSYETDASAAQSTAARTTARTTARTEASAASGTGASRVSSDEPYIARDGLERFRPEDVPAWSGEAYVAVNGNSPYFDTASLSAVSVEYYSELDGLGRCGMTYACVGQDTMPTEERGSISSVKPTGWHSVKYDCVEGKNLYNRCHLIGYQLTAENANEQNLITGTRYLNIQGMLPFENMVADYVKETGCHVAYRVTPYFDGDDLVAQGVLLEGYSVEDAGESVCFCVFAYNVQPGISIDYATGESELEETSGTVSYILNTNTHKYHTADCSSAPAADSKNRQEYTGSLEVLLAQGYTACSRCGG